MPIRCLTLLWLSAAVAMGLGSGLTAAAETIRLPSQWAAGERIDMIMTRARINASDAGDPVEDRAEARIGIQVLENRPDGYVFGWTVHRIEILESDPTLRAFSDNVSDLLTGIELQMKTNERGAIQSLQNLGEASLLFESAKFGLLDSLRRNGLTPSQYAELVLRLEGTFDASYVERSVLSQPRQLLMPAGGTYTVGKRIAYDDVVASPFGGDPFPSTGSIELTAYDERSGVAKLAWRQIIDSGSARAILGAILRQSEGSGMSMTVGGQPAAFSVIQEGSYEYDLVTGWPRKAVFDRRVEIGDFQESERTTFEAVDTP